MHPSAVDDAEDRRRFNPGIPGPMTSERHGGATDETTHGPCREPRLPTDSGVRIQEFRAFLKVRRYGASRGEARGLLDREALAPRTRGAPRSGRTSAAGRHSRL